LIQLLTAHRFAAPNRTALRRAALLPSPSRLHARAAAPKAAKEKAAPKEKAAEAPKAEKQHHAKAAGGAGAGAGAGAAAAMTLAQLESALAGKSYLGGFVASRADREAFDSLRAPAPGDVPAPNVERWARHMRSFSPAERAAWA